MKYTNVWTGILPMLLILIRIFPDTGVAKSDTNAFGKGTLIENRAVAGQLTDGIDLVCQYIHLSRDHIGPGDFIEISSNVKNVGSQMATGPSRIQYFLSTDRFFDAGEDPVLAYDIMPQLKSDHHEEIFRFVQISDAIPYDIYYIGVQVDVNDELSEGDETNNIFISDEPVLTIQNQRSEWTVVFSDDFEKDFGWPKWNSTTPSGDYGWERTSYQPYSGNYALWCASKALHGKPKLDPTQANAITAFRTKASGVPIMDFTECEEICIFMDYWGHDKETDPNFKVTYGSQPGGATGSVEFEAGSKPGWQQIHRRFSNSNAWGMYYNLEYNTLQPLSNNGVFLDNFTIMKYDPFAELTCDINTLNVTEAAVGDTFSVDYTLSNAGLKSALQVPVRFYLSSDETFSNDDYRIASMVIEEWEKMTDFERHTRFSIPLDVLPGTYYFCVVIDPYDTTPELVDEENVFFASGFPMIIHDQFAGWQTIFMEDFESVFPWPTWNVQKIFGIYEWEQLSDQSFSGFRSGHCPKVGYVGKPGYESWMTLNETIDLTDCEDAVLEFYANYYMGPFDHLDVCIRHQGGAWSTYRLSDRNWGWEKKSFRLSDFSGQNFIGSNDIEIVFKFRGEYFTPPVWPEPQPVISMYVDYIRVRKQRVGFPDLTLTQIHTVPDSATIGETLILKAEYRNIGSEPSEATTARFYFSTDSSLSQEDHLIGSYNISALAPAASDSIIEMVQVPSGLAQEPHVIIGVIDDGNLVAESNEENNMKFSVPIFVHPPHLQVVVIMKFCDAGFFIDEGIYFGSKSFSWPLNSPHEVEADSLFAIGDSIQYVFQHWSDGEARSHQITVTPDLDTLAAIYTKQYLLQTSVQAGTGGTVHPEGNQWVNADISVEVNATPDEAAGYVFIEWVGDITATENPVTVVMDGPKSMVAVFGIPTAALDIATEPCHAGFTVDGDAYSGSASFSWDIGSLHHIEADSLLSVGDSIRYVFEGWSNGGERSHSVTVSEEMQSLTATYVEQFLLRTSVQDGTGGSVNPDGETWVQAGTSVEMTATPDQSNGYEFLEWSGDAEGSENPISITLNKPKNIIAVFILSSAVGHAEIPAEFCLKQNVPNPFNPETRIAFDIPEAGEITIEVFDLMGRKIRTLIREQKQPGSFQTVWDGRNDMGHVVGSGTYIYTMRCGAYRKRMKAVFLK